MDQEYKRPKAKYEPGELDKTRRNIGTIAQDEAAKMVKVLGGEVGVEKIPEDEPPARRSRGYIKKRDTPAETVADQTPVSEPAAKKTAVIPSFPSVSAKERTLMDKQMMSADYKIKPNYGIFNFLVFLSKNRSESVDSSFISVTLKTHIQHLKSFSSCLASMLSWAPESFRLKVMQEQELRYRYFRVVTDWPCAEISQMYENLSLKRKEVTIPMLVPLIRLVYRCVLPLTYLNEMHTAALIKDMYDEIAKFNSQHGQRLKNLAKNSLSEWRYITTHLHKRLYPLLMRMCSAEFVAYPAFFTECTTQILSFLNLTRYDMFLPESKQQAEEAAKRNAAAAKSEEAESAPQAKEDDQAGNMSDQQMIKLGLIMLDKMFPEAGWLTLYQMPDMYPYFQPLYDFSDGFTLLARDNPVQVIIVLLRILEDLFQGCRNINFYMEQQEQTDRDQDSFISILGDISVYRETLFDKRYGEDLKQYVNSIYSQKEFAKGQFGKKLMSDILWKTKYYFLPYFEFQQPLIDKPANDNPYRSLGLCINHIKTVLAEFTEQIRAAAPQKMPIPSITNVWERYNFGLPNPVSRRLDVLLGAKRRVSSATNASLIKYALGVAAVLNWWINDKMSPAYQCAGSPPYRVSPTDGDPLFSIAVRNDQDRIFMQCVRASMSAAQAKAEKKEAPAEVKPSGRQAGS